MSEISLKQYVEVMTNPSHMIYVFDKTGRLVCRTQQACLKKDKLIQQNYTIARADYRLEFHRYRPGSRNGPLVNVTEQNAGVYSLMDVTVCKYIEIHLEQEIPAA